MNDQRLCYRLEEAGKLLSLKRSAIYSAARNGSIPTVKVGGLILVPKAALERMLECSGRNQTKEE